MIGGGCGFRKVLIRNGGNSGAEQAKKFGLCLELIGPRISCKSQLAIPFPSCSDATTTTIPDGPTAPLFERRLLQGLGRRPRSNGTGSRRQAPPGSLRSTRGQCHVDTSGAGRFKRRSLRGHLDRVCHPLRPFEESFVRPQNLPQPFALAPLRLPTAQGRFAWMTSADQIARIFDPVPAKMSSGKCSSRLTQSPMLVREPPAGSAFAVARLEQWCWSRCTANR
jgi:hypothetical protein